MPSWWDRTDPSDDPARSNRVPDGIVACWWNVIGGAAFVLGFPTIVLTNGFDAAHVAFALFGFVIAVVMEAFFLRKLLQRIAGRRGLRAELAEDQRLRAGDAQEQG